MIFQPLLYANVPAESPSYAPTFFVDNKPIMDYKESVIEIRRESLIIKKLNISSVVSQAVEPFPSKGQSSMSFLPGLGALQGQSLTEIQFNLSNLPEDAIALDTLILR